MKGTKDWILLVVVAVLGAGIFMALNDKVNSAILVLIISALGFAIGKLSKMSSGKRDSY